MTAATPDGGGPGALDRLLTLIVRGRVPVLLAAFALTAAALHLVLNDLAIDTDTTDMISAKATFRQNDIAFTRAFPQQKDTLVLVLDGPSVEAVEEAARRLEAALKSSPRFSEVRAPGGEAFFRRNGLLYLDTQALIGLSDRMALASPFLGALAAEPDLRGLLGALGLALDHLDDPSLPYDLLHRVVGQITASVGGFRELSWRRLFDLAGPMGARPRRVIIAQPRLDYARLSPAAPAIAEARDLAGALGIGGTGAVRLRLTGPVALAYEELKSAEIGGKTAAALSLVLVVLLLVFGLRSFKLIAATLLTLAVGLIWTGGFAALAVGHLNLISIAFAVLFVGLGVDFSIHFCLRYREEAGDGIAGALALRRAARGVGRGLVIAALGAGIGFYAFLPTDYRGFAELGLISGTGMFIALIANFTVLPALLATLPGGAGATLPRRDVWHAIQNLVVRHHRAVLVVSLLACLAALAMLPRLRFDFDPLNLKDPKSESFTTLRDLVRDGDSGIEAAEVLAPSLPAARALSARLAALDRVGEVRSIASFVPADQAARLAVVQDMALFLGPMLRPAATAPLDAAARRQAIEGFLARLARLPVPDNDEGRRLLDAARRLGDALRPLIGAGADLAGLDRRLTGRLPSLLDDLRLALEAGPIDIAALPASLRRQWIGRDGSYRLQVFPAPGHADATDTRAFVKAVLAQAPNASGTPVIVSEASDVVVGAFAEATVLAAAAIALLLVLLYRRAAFVALTLAPLVLAAVLTLATAAALGLALNFANVIVLPLLFGLGISSSVHLVERRRELSDDSELLHTTTPRAVLFSALTTLASFGSLAISAHRGMSSMGQLLTIAILYTLLCTLVVLPSLMPFLARHLHAGAGTAAGRTVE